MPPDDVCEDCGSFIDLCTCEHVEIVDGCGCKRVNGFTVYTCDLHGTPADYK